LFVSHFFFSLSPLTPSRLSRIFALARERVVEVETHPVNPEEYRFLVGGALAERARDIQIAPPPALARRPGTPRR